MSPLVWSLVCCGTIGDRVAPCSKPGDVIAGIARDFASIWRWKSAGCEGRPTVSRKFESHPAHESRQLSLGAAPRIHGDLRNSDIFSVAGNSRPSTWSCGVDTLASQSWAGTFSRSRQGLGFCRFLHLSGNDCVRTSLFVFVIRSGRGDVRFISQGDL